MRLSPKYERAVTPSIVFVEISPRYAAHLIEEADNRSPRYTEDVARLKQFAVTLKEEVGRPEDIYDLPVSEVSRLCPWTPSCRMAYSNPSRLSWDTLETDRTTFRGLGESAILLPPHMIEEKKEAFLKALLESGPLAPKVPIKRMLEIMPISSSTTGQFDYYNGLINLLRSESGDAWTFSPFSPGSPSNRRRPRAARLDRQSLMSKFVIKDTFFYKAKQDGFRARSAYKLKEVQDKFGLVRKHDRVLDLGCAPGSFLQVLGTLVGVRGKVVGVDILSAPPLPAANVMAMKLDIREMDVRGILTDLSFEYFDVITCDIAPNLSGIREADERHVNELFETVLTIVRDGLRTGGNLLIKSFFSDSFKETDRALKNLFRKVSVFKPSASRRVSSEVYFVCFGKR